jgi:hypothetical protein
MIVCTRRLWPACIRLIGGALLVLLTPGLLAAQQAASDSPAPATSGSPSLAAPMNPALFEGLWQPGGQDAPAIPDYRSPECPGCPNRNWGRAVAATIGVNVIFTLTNLAFRPDERYEFQVTPRTWWDNLKYGFIFDDNHFLINQFGHPYQGGLYFSTGRANGLNYWESSALVALGSFTWECCGETNRASMNDYFSTTMGGMVMGEIQHRMATLVLDTTATEGRIAREVAAMAIDPVGGFFRIIHGEWGKVRENRPDRRPDVISMSLQTGALWRGAGGTLDEASAFPYVELDFGYGDLVRTPFRKPFDAFQSSFVLGGGKGVSELVVLGRVYGKSLSQSPAGAASFLITQGFAYLTNPAYDLGGQSVDVGIGTVKTLGRRTSLSFLAMGQFVPLAAISAEYVDINERTYDFGPAIGASFIAALRWYGDPVLRLFYHSSFINSVNGSDATHYVDMLQARAQFPIGRTFAAGGSFTVFTRNSEYPAAPAVHTRYPESRVFLSYRF